MDFWTIAHEITYISPKNLFNEKKIESTDS